jgi:hypothetical protein
VARQVIHAGDDPGPITGCPAQLKRSEFAEVLTMAVGNYHIGFNRMSLEDENGQNFELPILAIDSRFALAGRRSARPGFPHQKACGAPSVSPEKDARGLEN